MREYNGKYGDTFACKCVAIDCVKCDFNAEVIVSTERISSVSIYDVTRSCYDSVKQKEKVVLCLKKDGVYLTVITSYLAGSSSRYCEEKNLAETGITLRYVSSKLLYGFDCTKEKIQFTSFTCEITDGMELIGEYPFEHIIEGNESNMKITTLGNVKYKNAALGFSYFVAPYTEKNRTGYTLSYQYKIQYENNEPMELDYIENIVRNIILFFELLCGEVVTVNKLDLCVGESITEYIGVNNFLKDRLKCLKNGFDTTSYLRQSIFKLSDFGEEIGGAVEKFKQIQRENLLSYESYKQILLDEEVEIITYNKFLKAMQIVEGYQRSQVEEQHISDFDEKKQEIINKLENDVDKEFISRYTKYSGETFRKCLSGFTYEAMKHISGMSKTKAKECADKLIENIINDRDVYTHASKTTKPCLAFDEIGCVITCYKMFFRVLNLHRFGLPDDLIRKRLRYNRVFVAHYKKLFGLDILCNKDDMSTGEFDSLMWGYDDRDKGE